MFQKMGLLDDYFTRRGDIKPTDYGRFNATGREEDRFVFKVPSLRNVALTAPYFHDGSVASLDEAVRIMAMVQLGRQIGDEEAALLVAFLKTLTAPLPPEPSS
jgi:cytochrome c peroxidase